MIYRIVFFCIALAFTDVYIFLGIRRIFVNTAWPVLRRLLIRLHLAVVLLFLAYTAAQLIIAGNPGSDPVKFRSYFTFFSVFVVLYLPKLLLAVFMLGEDLYRGCRLLLINVMKVFRTSKMMINKESRYITYKSVGALLSTYVFLASLYGVLYSKTDFRVKTKTLYFRDLPKQFDELRIVQLSDIHLGGFRDTVDVAKGLNLAQSLRPDLVVFTGDLVNTRGEEAEPYQGMFSRLAAPLGKIAILGNHDMNDFASLGKEDLLEHNVRLLSDFYAKTGFDLLRNEHCFLVKGNDTVAVAGIDNWGRPPFKKYGDLPKALKDVDHKTFTILLSHDPTSWDALVIGKTHVALTLSGHTHGMQLGFDHFGLCWSPSALIYHHYLGLYTEAGEMLYVNAGFGYIGFSGRIGILPEITLLTLRQGDPHP